MASNRRSRATREHILAALSAGESTIEGLQQQLDMHRNSIRRHLYQLHAEGLVVLTPRVDPGQAFNTAHFCYHPAPPKDLHHA